MSLQAGPLPFDDFSGGITENVLQGDPRRYERADNFFITIDKKLEERAGFVLDGADSCVITGASGQRINGYYCFQNESVLMPQVSRNLYYKNTSSVWTPIYGINSKEAISGADQFSQTTFGEFQKTIYLATDYGQGVLPTKIYKDSTNTWVARTAGLPRAWVQGNYTTASLLAKCITNANALRASMILHLSDAKYATYQAATAYETSPGDLHVNIDNYALCYLQTTAFGTDTNAPSPLPTPAPVCTSQATMFTLVAALNKAYTAHAADSMLNSWGTHPQSTTVSALTPPRYHQDPPVWTYYGSALDFPLLKTKGPGATLSNNATPDSVAEAASMLDDLWRKWNWHRLAVNTHDELNNYAVFNRYAPQGTKIGTVQTDATSFPTITPDWGDLIAYGNNLRSIFNGHVTNTPGTSGTSTHKQRDNSICQMQTECTLPECTDLDSFYLLIWWIRSLYQLHYYDALQPSYLNISGATTAGSTSITTLQYVTSAAAPGALATAFLTTDAATYFAPLYNAYQYSTPIYTTTRMISGSGATQAALQKANSTSPFGGQVSASQYHSSYSSALGSPFVDNAGTPEITANGLGVDVTVYGTDTASWLALANDLFFSMANHIQYRFNHTGGTLATTTYQTLVNAVPYANFFVPTVSTVSYALFYSDDYVVETNGIEYLVQGNPVFSDSQEVAVSYPVGAVPENLYPTYYTAKAIITQRGTALSGLPVLVNDAVTNYAVSNVNLNIYRTTDGGQTFYLLNQATNGYTSYVDYINDTVPNPGDTALSDRETIYTSGGVVGFDAPPACKFTHILNNTAYWGAVEDSGQFFPNRIRQSIQNNPDASPATFYDDLDSPLVGISSTRNNLIAFCSKSIYRMQGTFNLQGQGALTHENISDTLGCLNAKGIIKTEIGVFFPGQDGFYYTDGYQVIPITLDLKKTYASLTSSPAQCAKIYGAYDRITRRILWSMCESPTDTDNSVIYVYYLDYGVKPSGTFTLYRNASTLRPSSLVFQSGVMYLSHEKGYLLKQDQWTKSDITVDSTVSPSLWVTNAIPYNFTSTAFDCGTTFNRKWITKIHMVGKNTGNMAIQPYAVRDMNQTSQGAVAMAPINYAANFTWGQPGFIWGSSSCIWKTDGKMDLWRRFPSTTLRSDFMQVKLVPSDKCVYSSSNDYPSFCFATINSTTKAVTILTPSGYTSILWPLDVVGYRLKFANDSYVTEYTITAIDSTKKILTVSDPSSTIVTANSPGVEWEIWGIKKEQRVTLTSFVLHYAQLGQENEAYPGSKSNAGPGNGGQNP